MARIKMWNPTKTNDYQFFDRSIGEHFYTGGTGVFIHKYVGSGNGDETSIEDVVLMENRTRRYDDTIYELYGIYSPNETEFDLTQFGFMLSNDIVVIDFHINQMIDGVGRKLMSGDVLELPHLREHFALNEDTPAYNKFFVVEDCYKSDSGYDPRWWPHVWRVKAKIMSASDLYKDIIGSQGTTFIEDSDGNRLPVPGTAGHGSGSDCCDTDDGQSLIDIISNVNALNDIKDAVVEEASTLVENDPMWFKAQHLYVYTDDDGEAKYYYGSGDGVPPNSTEVFGKGTEFPEEMVIGDYYLRTDFNPPTLYQKQKVDGKKGYAFKKIGIDYVKPWTGAHRTLDTYIDNDDTDTLEDGTTIKQRQALSKAVRPKV